MAKKPGDTVLVEGTLNAIHNGTCAVQFGNQVINVKKELIK